MTEPSLASSPGKAKKRRWRGTFLHRFTKNRSATVGAIILVLLAAVAVAAPLLAPYPYQQVSTNVVSPPSREHVFGTDHLGRDTLSGVVMGTRTSLLVGVIAAITSVIVGVFIGLIAGYFGGLTDEVLMRITEFVLVTPTFFLVLVVVTLVGPSIVNIVLVIGLFSWPRIARVIRGQVLSLKQQDYVQAVRALGAGSMRSALRHVLPNALAAVVVVGSLQVGQAILLESALSFLGLGDPLAPSWGKMLNSAQSVLNRSLWQAFFPGLAIFLAVLSINVMGDGLNDALNPRMRIR